MEICLLDSLPLFTLTAEQILCVVWSTVVFQLKQHSCKQASARACGNDASESDILMEVESLIRSPSTRFVFFWTNSRSSLPDWQREQPTDQTTEGHTVVQRGVDASKNLIWAHPDELLRASHLISNTIFQTRQISTKYQQNDLKVNKEPCKPSHPYGCLVGSLLFP